METYTGQKVEAHPGTEGKTYGYQQPQGSEHAADGSVADKKEQLINAFEQLIEAMLKAYQPGGGGGQVTAGGPTTTGSYVTTGAPSTAGMPGTAVSTGRPSAPAKGTGPNGGGEEAFAVITTMLQESYRQDRARELAKKSEPETRTTAGRAVSKHMPDSKKSPLRAIQEFAPSFGKHGRSRQATMEVIAAPVRAGVRPENAPSAPIVRVPIEAHFASFGSAAERAEERARAVARSSGLQQPRAESIIGADDRTRVTNTQEYPFSCICSLLIKAQTGNFYVGTGWLVGPRLILTAGHCVYMADEGGWVDEIEIMPGRDGDVKPFGSVVSGDVRSVSGWTIDGDRDYDYGAILLPENHRLGDELGWFGYAPRADDYLRGTELNLAGYPGDGGPTGIDGTQWFMSRAVQDVNEKQITYQIDTFGGQSGAPVWEMAADGGRYGVAIHTWGTDVVNGATRITQEVFDNIVSWAAEVP